MADDWENIVIETGVDTLLDYLAENGQASSSQLSKDLGVSEDRIKEWAEALESKDFIEKTYSARKGLILKYTKSNKSEVDERLEEVREEVEKETEKVQKEMKSKGTEIEQQKKKLKEMAEELEENREKEDEVKNHLEELEELEEEIEGRLEEQKEKEEKLHSHSVNLLSRIDNALNRIDQAEEKAEDFESEADEIQKKVKALKKLERHSEKVEELDRELEDLKDEEEDVSGIYSSFKEKISNILDSKNGSPNDSSEEYRELLSKPVSSIKEELDDAKDPEYKKILEAEKNGKNRQTLKKFLERNIDE